VINIAEDIHSLSHFKRHTAEFVNRLKETGNPLVLTVNGNAQLVVQDAAAYQRLTELADRAEMMEFLEASRKEVDAGRALPAKEALDKLARKYKLARHAE
jgi:prevent-host-death family protein